MRTTITKSIPESKTWMISAPQVGDNMPFFTPEEITLLGLWDVIDGPGTSVKYNINFSATRNNNTPTQVWSVDRQCNSQSGLYTKIFTNKVIPANSWIWITVSEVVGSPIVLSLTYQHY